MRARCILEIDPRPGTRKQHPMERKFPIVLAVVLAIFAVSPTLGNAQGRGGGWGLAWRRLVLARRWLGLGLGLTRVWLGSWLGLGLRLGLGPGVGLDLALGFASPSSVLPVLRIIAVDLGLLNGLSKTACQCNLRRERCRLVLGV